MNNTEDFPLSNTSLKDICVYDAKLRGDEFVGIKYENGHFRVQFPLGYSAATDENEIRKDILNLVSVLSSFSDDEESFVLNDAQKAQSKAFPIHAYMFLIKDFLQNGYYSERETVYSRASSGKINWGRTIKQVKPQLVEDSSVYLEFVTRKTNHNENELISQIHRTLVFESFSKIGWLFSSFAPQKGGLKFNANLFRSVLNSKISQTFEEKKLLLFKNMLAIIDYMDSSSEEKSFYYGTEHFEGVWERLVDTVFGESDKEKFYPKCRWFIKGKGEAKFGSDIYKKYFLRPDTIMITNRGRPGQKIFVLDSKYYKYGVSKRDYDLPGTGSIVKQLAYAEFIEGKPNSLPGDVKNALDENEIYNAFILPGRLEDGKKLEYFGYSCADFKVDGKPYSKIHGLTIDMKFLMHHHIPNDKKLTADLADAICL